MFEPMSSTPSRMGSNLSQCYTAATHASALPCSRGSVRGARAPGIHRLSHLREKEVALRDSDRRP
ncbi:hypothetical protein GCM10009563_20530 [Subtercola frigoramans]